MFIFGNGFSQTILDQPLQNVKRQPLATFLAEIEKQHPVKFYYLEEWLAIYHVGEHLNGYTLKTMLDEMLAGSDINYTFHFGYALIFAKDASRAIQRESIINKAIVSDVFDITEKMFLEVGLRYSLFNRLGPATVSRYQTNAAREVRNIVDSVSYKRGAISTTYYTPEPRVFLRYQLNERTSTKIGYNRMAQYLHQVTNSAAITPTDIWQSCNAYFKPQVADQISAGVFRNISGGMFESFVEAYVKKVRNVLDFKDGALPMVLNCQHRK